METKKLIKWAFYGEYVNEQNAANGDIIYIAQVLSRNAAIGSAAIFKMADGYSLFAYSNQTGRNWKSPNNIFPTIQSAIDKANEIWLPV